MYFSNLISFILLVFLVRLKFASGASADRYFDLCSRSSKDFEKCIQKSIMTAAPKLVNGVPEINFPPLEPMSFSPLPFKENNRHFKMSALFSNVKLGGLSNLTVENVKVDGNAESGMTINLTVTGPVFRFWGKWKGQGRALQFSVNGNGLLDVNITQTDFRISIKGQAQVNKKDGKKYFIIKSMDLDPVIRKANVNVTGLFPNDENLNKAANKFFNRNIQFLLKILSKYPKEYFGGEFKKVIKIVFETWPIDELILP